MTKACKIRRGKKPTKRRYNALRKKCVACDRSADRAMAVQVGAVLYEYLPWPEYGEACYYEVYNANSYAYNFNRIWLDAQSLADGMGPQVDHAMADARACLGIIV